MNISVPFVAKLFGLTEQSGLLVATRGNITFTQGGKAKALRSMARALEGIGYEVKIFDGRKNNVARRRDTGNSGIGALGCGVVR